MASRFRVALFGSPFFLALSALAFFRPPDGHEHAAAAQFIGRFHPAIVHFPIALLALVLVLEGAGQTRRWASLRDAAGFVLILATLAAFAAAFLGWLLAWSGGYQGRLVTLHLWSGVWLCLACIICGALRPRAPAGSRFPYGLALAATVALMIWTGHLGGQLTHGESYLTSTMPARMRAWIGLPPLRPSPAQAVASRAVGPFSFYQASIAPIFESRCATCHGPNKQKGKLRLDSYDWILRGGEDGPVIKPGNPKGSELYRRITLSQDDDDFMPSGGKPPLKPHEVSLIEIWILTGAYGKAP